MDPTATDPEKTFVTAAISAGSPICVPVPCISMYPISSGRTPAFSSTLRKSCSWAAASDVVIDGELPLWFRPVPAMTLLLERQWWSEGADENFDDLRKNIVIVVDGILEPLKYNGPHKVSSTVAICIITICLAVARF